jgi:hypothetical protein
MRMRTFGLFVAAAALVGACSPGPGSAEWCKGVIEGKIKASQAELEAHSEACEKVLMNQVMGAIGQ